MHKIGSRVEASRDKEGLFKTLNAPIKNTYKSIRDGFWNVLKKNKMLQT
jgi:hypothetical protein